MNGEWDHLIDENEKLEREIKELKAELEKAKELNSEQVRPASTRTGAKSREGGSMSVDEPLKYKGWLGVFKMKLTMLDRPDEMWPVPIELVIEAVAEYEALLSDKQRLMQRIDECVRLIKELKAEMEALKQCEPRLCAHGYIHRTCGDCNVQNDQYIFGGYHGR